MTTRPPKTEPRAYHHGDLRRALIVATKAIVEESGAESFTLREAARRAGVNHRAAYRHFEDKSALLAAVAEEGFVELSSRIEAALAREPEGASSRRLMAIARA
ncbi:MAG: TetR/AcrR family transcriptional regulator [Myxococcales bacterium]|nr:TetR/AcrR family transcriptional regulator [Myxococcales bacterium]